MSSALSQARMGLLYHCVWDKTVADETFARWSRTDIVEYGAIAEAIYTYDHSPDPHEGGVARAMGISNVLHGWMAAEENLKRPE